MSKIICEICGTVYPDNATQCPICAYPRKTGDNTDKPEAEKSAPAASSSERVKGGRFSNSNVKKRNKAAHQATKTGKRRKVREEADEPAVPKRKSDRGLVITVLVLLVAVIFVGAYIALRFFRGADAYNNQVYATGPSTEATESAESVPEDTGVACTDFEISGLDLQEGVEFLGKGRGWRMNITTVPENTTDTWTVTSSDENVVTVTSTDSWVELISVAPGTATVTVTCGAVVKEFPVVCNFEGDTEESTEETESTEGSTEEATEETHDSNWKLNFTDAAIGIGYSFELKLTNDAGEVAPVVWTCSSDDISINGNTITGKSLNSYMEVTGTYDGKTYMCIVRVLEF